MVDPRQVRIGDLLKEYGYVNDEQIDQALAYQRQHDVRLGQAVLDLGFVSEKEFLQALSHKTGFPLINLQTAVIDAKTVGGVPRELAEKANAIAINEDQGTVTLVTNDPLNLFALNEIEQVLGKPVRLAISDFTSIQQAIKNYYTEVDAMAAIGRMSTGFATLPEIDELSSTDIGDDTTPVVNLLNSLIIRSYAAGASDLHIEPFADNCRVRMRVDGALIQYAEIPRNVHPALIVRLKIMSNLDIAEKRLPQDGHFRLMLEGVDLNVRLSVIPTVFGEKAVLRFLTTNTAIDHADHFGMIQEDYDTFQRILASPNGIIYITGPTGSGKTTTMYMALEQFKERPVNISSIEDPVERNIDGINQVQVNVLAGMTFASGLRSLLRQDPDIIMVGETRDTETASTSVSAAITGHLVLSTLHTNDALTSIVRLEDMGVPSYLVGNSLVGLVAQRLVRKVCEHCKIAYAPNEMDLLNLRADASLVSQLVYGKGCHICNNTGYKGRIAVHEIVPVDKRMQRMIAEEAQMAAIYEYARKELNMKTLRDRAKSLVLENVTSMEEFMKIGETVD
ncbi:MAG: Flp pilus assembly complex ATPase component TadA [Coriobacteriia bacterium]|nr:Flp pilus assembly complex ATPase component TadA [Coriobacteriia bacterium]MCL2749664.1 Flp pilus assembly complex ATPase component TadA [Coriobacteriia bacterium]